MQSPLGVTPPKGARFRRLKSWIDSGNVGEVRRLRVAPEWRRCGLATALMQELIAEVAVIEDYRVARCQFPCNA
jgi:GNAT superfamily N-acetyltransferase